MTLELAKTEQGERIVDLLLHCPSMNQFRDKALEAVVAGLEADGALFYIADRTRPPPPNELSQINQEEVAKYAFADPFITELFATSRNKTFHVLALDQTVDMAEFRSTAIYTEFYQPRDLEQVLGAIANYSDDMFAFLGIYRSDPDRPFGAAGAAALRDWLPLLTSTLQRIDLQTRLEDTQAALLRLIASPVEGRDLEDARTPARRTSPMVHYTVSRPAAKRPRERLSLQLDSRLTPREREIADWVTRGMTNTQIAKAAQISPRTVELHVANMLRKFGLGNRTELAVAIARGAR